MKIYAGKSNDVSIDDFIGKDVWVKCRVKKWQNDSVYYVRFLYIDDGWNPLKVNLIPEESIGILYHNFYGDTRKYASEINKFNVDDITILEPLEVIDTKDIRAFEGVDSVDRSIFDEIVGEPLWIKVYSYESDDDFYIQIVSKQGDIIHYLRSYAYELEHPNTCDDSYGPPSESGNFCEKWYSRIDALDICEPLDVMSDEEMYEAIDACDAYWEENHEEEDYDDEDYE